jgi:phosphohistidine swiveling domain-containing protein
MSYTTPFSQLTKSDNAIAGGKGASLGEMLGAGIPVPNGFVVLAQTFEDFLKQTDLGVEIVAILHTVNHQAVHTIESASEKIQGLILRANMPLDIQTEILSEFTALGSTYVAVRSSATAEDGVDHAWAGQLDSYLNTTEAELLHNVQRCWASLFTPRAIFYRFEKGLHDTHISVAVVVQQMVNSEVSGIAFSVHPVTEDHNQLIIEAGFGLGEAIVSGSVTPDSYVVEKDSKNIIDSNVSEQKRALYRVEGGGNEWRDLSEQIAKSQVLNQTQILELSDIIIGIENHYGFPCDIEWAFEAEKFYIVQSRPITTLSSIGNIKENQSLPFRKEDYSFSGLWKCNLLSDWFWTTWLVPELAEKVKLEIQNGGILVISGGNFFVKKSTFQEIKTYIKDILSRNDEALLDTLKQTVDSVYKSALDRLEELKDVEVSTGLTEEIAILGQRMMFPWCLGYLMSEVFDEFLVAGADFAGIKSEDIPNLLPHFVTPLTKSMDEQREIKELLINKGYWDILIEDSERAINAIKGDAETLQVIEAYRVKYGWLPILNLVDEMLTIEGVIVQLTNLQKESARESHIIPESMNFLMKVASTTAYLRQTGVEYFSIYSYQAIPLFKKVAQKIGITYEQMLDLKVEEIISGFEGIDLKNISDKRAGDVWVISSGLNNTANVIDDPEIVKALAEKLIPKPEVNNSNEIKGQIGNKGKAIGSVKIALLSQDFSKIEDGDILVTTMTTPDFVPMMQKAAAIVTDIGGLLCHAAIISREMQKPCVIGTKFATQILKDGDLVEVDADNGVVRVLERN